MTASAGNQPSKRLVEIRFYRLKPETAAAFHQLVTEQCVPLLRRWGVDVVAFGPSLEDDDSYFLMRAYPSLEELRRAEDAFYASDDWRDGPRQAILDRIDTYLSVVVEMDVPTVDALRCGHSGRGRPTDHDVV